jgi:hypothetical protein
VKTKQRGAAAVEFGIIAMLFFTLLFGIIEMGRLFYVWNTVQEVTRRAARAAVVTDFTNTTAINAVKQDAVFGGSTLIAAPEVSPASVQITYLDLNRNVIADNDIPKDPTENAQTCADQAVPPTSPVCIGFVEVAVSPNPKSCDKNNICTYSPLTYKPMSGLFSYFALNIPAATVTMPAESMGYVPP